MGTQFKDDELQAEELALEIYREEMMWRKYGNQMRYMEAYDE